MKRFFAADIEPGTTRVRLDREESRHLTRVLRLQVGDPVELFDGSGALYTAEVEGLGKEVSVLLRGGSEAGAADEPPVVVCQGDLKGQKIDFLVEKCTELGVDRFIPFVADRSQGRRDDERQMKKLLRRRTIVKTACKQSGRLRFMEVEPESGFSDLLTTGLDDDRCLKLILWEKEQGVTLADVVRAESVTRVYLMFGPEGGFSAAEAEQALAAGWQPVGLGTRILRAETATIAAVSITQHLLGNM